ncbi:DHH family phosphoesterase [Spongiibacter sp. KMU-158]|uniref:DHH family phosphoesterase n=1 Tax=Spongiibacter pelagi TaxID=2760804 RepID=A0A927C4L6_9GAMM|nr:DHH family phosphoesterase [Spongiibacter pelagi]MBD2859912.1 DHH family phosphoesterase [Spongiibacter pelagi]
MNFIDVFNGDADGICALLQLRLAQPCDSQLVTGVKRDIDLLNRVQAQAGDQLTVLDVSLDKNRSGLESALAAGAEVFYVDHHFAGDIPDHPKLTTRINTAADVCTSLLVNGHLQGAFAAWAVVGAFGDNLRQSAFTVAKSLSLSEAELESLEKLGIYLNYNGYGADLDDLHFKPDALFKRLLSYNNPLDFIADGAGVFSQLEQGYEADMGSAAALQALHQNETSAVFILPNEAWARRVSGVYSNDLANGSPDRAHAVLTEKANGNFLISIRAPLSNKVGADEFCRQFPTGGGRAAAAGINDLPGEQLANFVERFDRFYRELAA